MRRCGQGFKMFSSKLCVGDLEEGCIPLCLLSKVVVPKDLRGLRRGSQREGQKRAGQGAGSARKVDL